MSISLQDIVNEIIEKYPSASSLTTDSLVKKIDNLQKRIFNMAKIRDSSQYTILQNQQAYPIDVPFNQIILKDGVLVNGVIYPYKEYGDFTYEYSQYFYFISGYLGIYPTPDYATAYPTATTTGTLTIFHYQTPTTLVSTNMAAIPDLDESFYKMLVYGVAAEITEGFRDTDIGNVFVMRYNDLEQGFLSNVVKPESESIHMTSGW